MKVFMSWSGQQSYAVADALGDYLRRVIQSLEPFLSSEIGKGARWNDEVAGHLEARKVGVVCLTPSNLTSPWVLFEAGALSKLRDGHVCTFLSGLKPSQIEPPLGIFQATQDNQEDILKLLRTVNAIARREGESKLGDEELVEFANAWWPTLEKRLKEAAALEASSDAPVRESREILEEILAIVRSTDRRMHLDRVALSVADLPSWAPPEDGSALANALANIKLRNAARFMNDEGVPAAAKSSLHRAISNYVLGPAEREGEEQGP